MIIKSLLDLDFYKLTMLRVIWEYRPSVLVRLAFRNRTSGVSLSGHIREERLREEFEHIRSLKITPAERMYLRQFFPEDFLKFLEGLSLSPYLIEKQGQTYRIEFIGSWAQATLWETFALSIISELYYQALFAKEGISLPSLWAEGERRLFEKIRRIQENPGFHFSDFGTRRRFSQDWHEHVLAILLDKVPQRLLGTSNVYFARKLGMRPIGTMAHEMDMVYSGIFHGSEEEIRASHQKMLEDWWASWGKDYSVALTDTYGSDFFFRDFTLRQAQSWKGLRCDSGDPFEFGERAISFYESLGIDPRGKLIVFSDGLDVETMISLYNRFKGRIWVTFGWGTNLTNDLGFKPLSLVVKVVKANGHGVVKLSDNLAKAVGDPSDIKRFKRIFGYTGTFQKDCVY